MRVGLDVSAVPESPAGAGRYIVELARRLPSVVDELQIVSRHGDQQRWAQISPSAAVAGIVPDTRPGRLVYEALRLARTDVVRAVDVWHSPHYTMPGRMERPVVVTIHDMTFFTHPEYHERSKVPFFTRAIKRAATKASCLIAVSDFTAREIDHFLSPSVPVVVAPHGVDLERFSPDVVPSRRFGAPYVLFVGTLEPRKGIDVLLRAFDTIGRVDAGVELVIAGQSGWRVDNVVDRIDQHPFVSRIHRIGYVSDDELAPLIRGARVVAYPSRGEGFGLPVLEALACGAPVVTSKDTVMADVAGTAATLVPVGDSKQLARSLLDVLALDEQSLRQISLVGRTRAEAFTWENSVAQHVKAYETAAHGS